MSATRVPESPRSQIALTAALRIHSRPLRQGEMLALVGESGCGKSTTAQAILGMITPTAGSIRLHGTDIAGLSGRGLRQMRRRVQMIYQDPYESLDPRFRVRATMEEPMQVHGIGSSRAERRALAVDALERAGLSPAEAFLDRYPHELSGGQRQRVAIAASLVLGPDLLLADEPVSMLDVSVRAGVLSLLDTLRRDGKMGILMITHDLSTAAHFADRIAVMYLGRIVEHGPARQVVRNPQHPYTRALLSVVPKRDPRERTTPQILTGETPTRSTSRPAAGSGRAARSPRTDASSPTRRCGSLPAAPIQPVKWPACSRNLPPAGLPAERRSRKRISVRVGDPVAPSGHSPVSYSSHAVEPLSMCTHGASPANSRRNIAANTVESGPRAGVLRRSAAGEESNCR